MKAAIRDKYGPPSVIQLVDLEKPTPSKGELLIKVKACTVNRTDCAVLDGTPYIFRFFAGFPRPRKKVLGTDFAGIVEAIGEGVHKFKVGDRVFGFIDTGLSSYAEYMLIHEKEPIALIPEQTTYEDAAGSIEGFHYALNFINKINFSPNEKVLINGASGAIGSAMLQILSLKKLEIDIVCDTRSIPYLQKYQPNTIYDYQKQDFTTLHKSYHYIVDAVGKSTFFKCKHLLKPKGIYVSSELGPWSQNILYALFTPLFRGKKVIFPLPTKTQQSLNYASELLSKKQFKPLIDKNISLKDLRETFEYVNAGKKMGNVILRMEH
ncbi:MAG: NAD(P)-dependent alcohol dehydrogenase [Bacteroidota bacterium]